MQKKYALVGLGGRGHFFLNAMTGRFASVAAVAGVCDSNEGRGAAAQRAVRDKLGISVPGYDADNFDKMIAETRPDAVIVTTMDCTHDKYICRAMELGCDVVTEKPMTVDETRCRRILDTLKRTGRRCAVTFNYRYSPPRTQVKDVLMSGIIGDVLSVDFNWLLDTSHGADYYRRWHRQKRNSGGLLVHKATHHFDLVNWWLGTVPETVFAAGQRKFYVPATAERLGLTNRKKRCLDCPEAARCPFHIDLGKREEWRRLYLECEKFDGYHRDGCVFDADMDIEDSMSAVVRYANGARLSYSLNSFSPWEGYIVSFNGTRGRIEHKCQETVYVSGDGSVPGELKSEGTWLRVYPHWSSPYSVPVWSSGGGHGGGDPAMLDYLFDPASRPPDKYLRAADHRSGAWSILTGIAANRSIAENRPIKIADLADDIGMPDYPRAEAGKS